MRTCPCCRPGRQLANGQNLFALLQEAERDELRSRRTPKERLVLLSRRLLGIVSSMTIQAFAGFVIIELTIQSAAFEESIKSKPAWSFLVPFASSIVPASVSVLNAIQPPLMHIIARFEKWDDGGDYTKGMVWRLFVAKLLNFTIQVRGARGAGGGHRPRAPPRPPCPTPVCLVMVFLDGFGTRHASTLCAFRGKHGAWACPHAARALLVIHLFPPPPPPPPPSASTRPAADHIFHAGRPVPAARGSQLWYGRCFCAVGAAVRLPTFQH